MDVILKLGCICGLRRDSVVWMHCGGKYGNTVQSNSASPTGMTCTAMTYFELELGSFDDCFLSHCLQFSMHLFQTFVHEIDKLSLVH